MTESRDRKPQAVIMKYQGEAAELEAKNFPQQRYMWDLWGGVEGFSVCGGFHPKPPKRGREVSDRIRKKELASPMKKRPIIYGFFLV
jgi:hypothetical protein